jgi:hypothetical protein
MVAQSKKTVNWELYTLYEDMNVITSIKVVSLKLFNNVARMIRK